MTASGETEEERAQDTPRLLQRDVRPFLPTDVEVQQLGEEGYFLRSHFVGLELARAACAELRALVSADLLLPAGLSRGTSLRHDSEMRGDFIAWLTEGTPGAALVQLREAFGDLGSALNATAYLGLGRFDVQLAHFPGNGARYVRHRDAFPMSAGENRRLTAIVYLNEDWQPAHGGHLRLYLDGGPRDVEPRLDTLVVFLSERIEHEVLPAFAPRLAATAWFYGRSG